MPKKNSPLRPGDEKPGERAAVSESLNALQEKETKLREQIEEMQRKVADAPRKLAETQRKQQERLETERKERARAERDEIVFDHPRALSGSRSSGPRRAVKLKVEQRAVRQQTWALVIFLLVLIFMLWSALT